MKVGVCGYYGEGNDFQGGQPIKTKNLYDELVKMYGLSHVDILSTSKWKYRPFHIFLRTISLHKNSDNLIIIPAKNGIRVFGPLFSIYNIFNKKRLHYVVIGGWLHSLLQENRWLLYYLKKYDGIYVETNVMKIKLEDMGLKNVYILKNFKQLQPIKIPLQEEVACFKFCTFSRVVKNKGIEDAVKIIEKLRDNGFKCSLDIYGPIYDEYEDEFNSLLAHSSAYISYKGLVNPEDSVEVLKNYYMLLFPTRFYTEGVPGTIIDSYYAGLPVIASKWESFSDVIYEYETGIGYGFNDFEDFYNKAKWAVCNQDIIYKMRFKCIEKSNEFSPERIISDFTENLK